MKTVAGHLDESFLRIHKSYVVNINYIEEIIGNQIKVITGDRLEISRSKRELLLNMLNVVTPLEVQEKSDIKRICHSQSN